MSELSSSIIATLGAALSATTLVGALLIYFIKFKRHASMRLDAELIRNYARKADKEQQNTSAVLLGLAATELMLKHRLGTTRSNLSFHDAIDAAAFELLLPISVLTDLKTINSLRNDVVHSGYSPTKHDVVKVLSSLEQLSAVLNATDQTRQGVNNLVSS